MRTYLLKRFLLSIPTLLVISVAVFFLGQMATDDPIAKRGGASYTGNSNDPDIVATHYAVQAKQYGLDLPLFYITVHPDYLHDTLYRVYPYHRRHKMADLAHKTGSWDVVAQFDRRLTQCIQSIEQISFSDTSDAPTRFNSALSDLNLADSKEKIEQSLDTLSKMLHQYAPTETGAQAAFFALAAANKNMHPRQLWAMPRLNWNGFDNQYHVWFKGFLGIGASVGTAYVWEVMRGPIYCTFLVSGIALLLALLLAVPLGLYAAQRKNHWQDTWIKGSTLVLYAIPTVVIGCVLRYTFATPGHGLDGTMWATNIDLPFLDLSTSGFWAWCSSSKVWPKLILPILALIIHICALLTLQMRTGALGVMQQDFIRTARAKGLSEYNVLSKHVLRNALFPLITVLSHLIPSILGGALVLEAVFNFRGLGDATISALRNDNYPVLMAIILLGATTTIVCSLLADLIYAYSDPRIQLGNNGSPSKLGQ